MQLLAFVGASSNYLLALPNPILAALLHHANCEVGAVDCQQCMCVMLLPAEPQPLLPAASTEDGPLLHIFQFHIHQHCPAHGSVADGVREGLLVPQLSCCCPDILQLSHQCAGCVTCGWRNKRRTSRTRHIINLFGSALARDPACHKNKRFARCPDSASQVPPVFFSSVNNRPTCSNAGLFRAFLDHRKCLRVNRCAPAADLHLASNYSKTP